MIEIPYTENLENPEIKQKHKKTRFIHSKKKDTIELQKDDSFIDLNINLDCSRSSICSILNCSNNYSICESKKCMTYYGKNLMRTLENQQDQEFNSKEILQDLTKQKNRTSMINWLIEITHLYHQSDETFSLTVHIMDKYLTIFPKMLDSLSDVHIIGITSLFMASKFQEIRPIHMDILQYKIGYNHFSG